MSKNTRANFKDMYFPRPGLAQEYLDVFDGSDSRAITIFGHRGIGKTAFLQNDLIPLAASAGRVPVYIDLWSAKTDPGNTIAQRLREETQKIWGTVTGKRELRGGALDLGPVKIGLNMDRQQVDEPAGALHRISFWMSQLAAAAGRKKVMLLLDEIQTLGRAEGGTEIAASLRAGMQTNYGHYEAIFTGSSRDQLAAMFRDLRAPLWSYGSEQLFPALGREFTDSVCRRYQQVTGGTLDRDFVLQAFEAVGRNPESIINFVRAMVLDGRERLDREDIKCLEVAHIVKERESKFNALASLERAVLIMITEKVPPFGAEALKYYAAATGEAVTVSAAQKAVNRMRAESVLYQGSDSRYAVENPLLAEWVQNRHPQSLGLIVPYESSPPFEPAIPTGDYTGVIKSVNAERVLQDVGEGRVVSHARGAKHAVDETLLRAGRVVRITYSGRSWNALDPNTRKPGKSRKR